MRGARWVILTVRFLLELGLLAALAVWGFHAGVGATAWVFGLVAPLLAAAVWGAFVAPRARWPVPVGLRLAIELVLFGLAAVGLAATGRGPLAVAFAVLAFATSLANAATEGAAPTTRQ
ncbi:MAG: YrdB family protein [Planctomycetaceae bacterium]